MPGDVNADGAITNLDAATVSRLASLDTIPSWVAMDAADVAGPFGGYRDNHIDWRDVARILRAAGGLEALPNSPESSLGSVFDAVTVTADTSKNYALQAVASAPANSVLVSGHVNGAIPFPAPAIWKPLGFYHFDKSGRYTVHEAEPDVDGDYKVLLPPDDYTPYSFGTVIETTSVGTLDWQYNISMDRQVMVSGPMALDLTAPPPPVRGRLTGVIQTANLVPTRIYITSSVDSNPSRNLLAANGILGTDAYVLAGVPATYNVLVEADYPSDPAMMFRWRRWDPVAMTTDSTVGPTLTLPPVVPVAFHLTIPAGSGLDIFELASQPGNVGTLWVDPKVEPDTNLVQTAIAAGWATVSMELSLHGPESARRAISYSTGVLIPAEGGEQTIPLPPLPQLFTFSGGITLPDGAPAGGETMALFQTASDSESQYRMRARITTDADGVFSAQLLPGIYQVMIPAR